MKITKKTIIDTALSFGADDIAFVKDETNPDFCIIVLFFRYYAALYAQPGKIALSPYYMASNRGYHTAKKLTAFIKEQGLFAEHDIEINAKTQALKSGGFIAQNGFYYHPDFGSLICIQTIRTDAVAPDESKEPQEGCLNCGACKAVCPSSGVGNLENCLRKHSSSFIPKQLRSGLYQLIGCELCQTVCPLNSKEQRQTPQYSITELLKGKHIKEIQELAGKNMARKQRILSHAAIHAANTGQKEALEQLKHLSETSPSPTKEHAEWAIHQLEEDE